jgi:hypothetical protein
MASLTEPCKQWGPTNSISDITPATGWKITSCDPVAMKQDIELVCDGDNPDCGHLFQGGAMDTIVRLPDNVCFGFAVRGLDPVPWSTYWL